MIEAISMAMRRIAGDKTTGMEGLSREVYNILDNFEDSDF